MTGVTARRCCKNDDIICPRQFFLLKKLVVCRTYSVALPMLARVRAAGETLINSFRTHFRWHLSRTYVSALPGCMVCMQEYEQLLVNGPSDKLT